VRRLESAGIVIAAVDGLCAGPDFERAVEADIRIAAGTATFSADGVADVAACGRRLARLLGEARAKEIVLGARFDLRGGGTYAFVENFPARYIADLTKRPKLKRKVQELESLASTILEVQRRHQLPMPVSISTGFMPSVFRWASGDDDWTAIVEESFGGHEGDLIRAMRRLIDLLHQLADSAETPVETSRLLADVAPTMLQILGLPRPKEMEGRSLLEG